mgnify:CR=1 FL=1
MLAIVVAVDAQSLKGLPGEDEVGELDEVAAELVGDGECEEASRGLG